MIFHYQNCHEQQEQGQAAIEFEIGILYTLEVFNYNKEYCEKAAISPKPKYMFCNVYL